MSLKRLITIATCTAVLAGCGATRTLNATATVRSSDPAKIIGLIQASERVLKRRLAAADVQDAVVSVAPAGAADATVVLRLPDAAAEDAARRILSEPFTFEIKLAGGMIKDPSGAEVVDWQATGITGADLEWIQPVRDTSTDTLGVDLQFGADGRAKLASVFKVNQGKDVGIFVRDLLVSKLRVNSADIGNSIVISGIPSAAIAEIFADDVNVGLHVVFSLPQ